MSDIYFLILLSYIFFIVFRIYVCIQVVYFKILLVCINNKKERVGLQN